MTPGIAARSLEWPRSEVLCPLPLPELSLGSRQLLAGPQNESSALRNLSPAPPLRQRLGSTPQAAMVAAMALKLQLNGLRGVRGMNPRPFLGDRETFTLPSFTMPKVPPG